MGGAQGIFKGVKLLHETDSGYVSLPMSKPTACIIPRVNPDGNYGLGVRMVSVWVHPLCPL